LVFAVRDSSGEPELMGLPRLRLGGLDDEDARSLLASVFPGRMDEQLRDRILSETNGNPLALLELPRVLDPAQAPGGLGLVGTEPVPARIQEGFRQRVATLPEDARSLLLVAAAEPVGDPVTVLTAAEMLGISPSAADAAQAEGLLEIGARVRFRHPLVRSAVYSSASPAERRSVHQALAEATDRLRDPDRRAWHLAAAAAPWPNEQVARDLEDSADRARSRGGIAAAAAFLHRAVELTPDPARKSERSLGAAQANLQAGAFDEASKLLTVATAGPLDEMQQGRVDLLRGQIAFASNAGSEAPSLLAKAARRLEGPDAALARATYLDAFLAAVFAGELAAVGNVREVARAARTAPPPQGEPRPPDLLLNALAILVTEGRFEAAPLLRQAAALFAQGEITLEEGVRWGWLATVAATMVWDEECWQAIDFRQLQNCREAGLLASLTIYANAMAVVMVWRGDFAGAASLIDEAEAIAKATGIGLAPYGAVLLAGFRGAEAEAAKLISAVSAAAREAGQGAGVQWSQFVSAVLYNGLGQYERSLASARQAAEQVPELDTSMWALVELIEAASRTGNDQIAAEALEGLAEATRIGQTDWGLGIYARSRALLSDDGDAEDWYREAVDRLGRTQVRMELARSHLVYGEWLRRQGRRVDAREQLRTAHEMLTRMGAEAFADRARRELLATGQNVARRRYDTRKELTPQEYQIAQLAAERITNPEIAAQLFISTATVDYHLRKVFRKLEISSRRQLGEALKSQTAS
jgi:DNA-binding CsgD family transcriptional regulator